MKSFIEFISEELAVNHAGDAATTKIAGLGVEPPIFKKNSKAKTIVRRVANIKKSKRKSTR